jgi:hypothetical protein
MPIERHTTPSLARRTVHYLVKPGGIPKVLGIAVAVGTLASIPFVHPSLREAASGIGAAWMLWWLGFKVREKADRGGDE